jgi:DNA replication protein DnaC
MTQEIISRLKTLKLYGMAENWPELIARCRHAALEPEQLMKQMLDAEQADRYVRSIAYQMHGAHFPAHRDLAGFDFAASAVDEALVKSLHTTEFTKTAQNVVFIGGPDHAT